MGFCQQEYYSGFPFPPPGDLPNPGIKPVSPALAARFFTTEPPGKPCYASINVPLGRKELDMTERQNKQKLDLTIASYFVRFFP